MTGEVGEVLMAVVCHKTTEFIRNATKHEICLLSYD